MEQAAEAVGQGDENAVVHHVRHHPGHQVALVNVLLDLVPRVGLEGLTVEADPPPLDVHLVDPHGHLVANRQHVAWMPDVQAIQLRDVDEAVHPADVDEDPVVDDAHHPAIQHLADFQPGQVFLPGRALRRPLRQDQAGVGAIDLDHLDQYALAYQLGFGVLQLLLGDAARDGGDVGLGNETLEAAKVGHQAALVEADDLHLNRLAAVQQLLGADPVCLLQHLVDRHDQAALLAPGPHDVHRHGGPQRQAVERVLIEAH